MYRNGSGINEWADASLSIQTGCISKCKYCWAKANAIEAKLSTIEKFDKPYLKMSPKLTKDIAEGVVMFPSSHDITLENVDSVIAWVLKLVNDGFSVLIVTKPRYRCIEAICNSLSDFKDKIIFRFTIGSSSDKYLRFWEANTPLFKERIESLKLAYNNGFTTSLSCEPMLDKDIELVVDAALPFINDSIWLGTMNSGIKRVSKNGCGTPIILDQVKKLEKHYSGERLVKLYQKYCNNPLIKWKDGL